MKSYNIVALIILANSLFFTEFAASEIVGKASIAPGEVDSQDSINLEGNVTIPVKNGFSFQADGLYADVDGEGFAGVLGSFFWQKKATAYLGVDIGGVLSDLVDSYETSIEGEYYFNKITLGGKTGYASIKYDNYVSFIDTDKSGLFGNVYVNFYPLADFLLSTSVENRFDNTTFNVDAEYLLPVLGGLSVFGTAARGEHGYDHWFVGVRYYFGGAKSLKDKHRGQGPQKAVSGILSGITTYNAEYEEKERNAPAPPPITPTELRSNL